MSFPLSVTTFWFCFGRPDGLQLSSNNIEVSGQILFKIGRKITALRSTPHVYSF
jgi:hypothetical protein